MLVWRQVRRNGGFCVDVSANVGTCTIRPVAELLAGHGYRLYRPDAARSRIAPGFGSDVFASPLPGGSHS